MNTSARKDKCQNSPSFSNSLSDLLTLEINFCPALGLWLSISFS